LSGGPTVSVILPTFNRLKYLRAAVDSVLNQTFHDWELIIADDGSSEETKAYLRTLERPPKLQVLWLAHSGNPGTVRNAALRVASGEYVAFLDSDDTWLPQKLEIQINGLRASRGCQWSYTALTRIDDAGNPIVGERIGRWIPYSGAIFNELLEPVAVVPTPTVVVARRLLDQVGGFDEDQHLHEDYDLWLRLSIRSDVAVIETPLACVRSHTEHYSGGRIRSLEARHRLLEKMQSIAVEPRMRSMVLAAKSKNATRLARLFAVAGDRKSLVCVLSGSWRYSWWRISWWWASALAVLRMFVPDRLLSSVAWPHARAASYTSERKRGITGTGS
jgi:GT2 family glycosyltransferase